MEICIIRSQPVSLVEGKRKGVADKTGEAEGGFTVMKVFI